MVEEGLDDKVLGCFLRLAYPVPITQDANCPQIEWMGEDLVHCPGVGEYKCKAQRFEDLGEYGGISIDYMVCKVRDHTTYQFYIN
ncbi:hypothetical protein HYX11_01245 [Candidatus Woesearchaeota archaeon]|nr:hypothetical protein [Candidatus Woesearchaeota archaeon]